ncbi:MAG: c-type cytochrome domain-containing protein [Planctomycetota bacterium]
MTWRFAAQVLLLLFAFSYPMCAAQEVGLVDFARDVQPILDEKCLECHGPEKAKNDYRVDDEAFMDYVEAGSLEDSFLWDYLVTDDLEMKMPPPDKPQLTGAELATIKVWIEEGAAWAKPEPKETSEGVDSEQTEVQDVSQMSSVARLWLFQGLFHPASVHFPIALLVVSTVCLVLSFLNRDSFEPVAFHCLWMGALAAVAACVMGWGYAQHEGYGSGLNLQNSAINRHRWLGIAVAIGGLILIPLARRVRREGQFKDRLAWLVGGTGLLLAVSTVGYQGGELTYGEDHYTKEYYKLFPEHAPEESEDSTEADDSANVTANTKNASTDTDSSTEDAAGGDPESDKDESNDEADETDNLEPNSSESKESTKDTGESEGDAAEGESSAAQDKTENGNSATDATDSPENEN